MRLVTCLLFAAIVGCAAKTEMDASDPMRGGSSVPPTSTPTNCDACFTSTCAWERTTCAGDPVCSRLLSCATQCPADQENSVSAVCLNGCATDEFAGSAWDALARCVNNSTGCCTVTRNAAENSDSAAGPIGAGGAGGYGAAGAAGSSDGPDVGPGFGGTDPVCSECSCIDCLYAIKTQQETDSVCKEAAANCVHAEACHNFAKTFAACVQESRQGDLPVNVQACLFESISSSQAETNAIDTAQLQFMSEVVPCLAAHCHDNCISPCMSCQLERCPDEMKGFLSDTKAQRFVWCRATCDSLDNTCAQACVEELGESRELVSALLECTQSECGGMCK